TSIQAAIGGLKTASDIAQSLVTLRDASVVQAKTIELQSVILAAQSSAIAAQSQQFALLERIRELEEHVARVEAWNTEKKRYKLTEIGFGQFAYILKEEESAGEPKHMLCANCYNRGEKSILQNELRNPGRHTVTFCDNCNSEL